MRPGLISLRGAWVLSAGLYDAVGPPYRPGPPLDARPLARNGFEKLLSVGERRPWLVRVSARATPPPLHAEIVAVGEGHPVAPLGARCDPPHGSEIARDTTPVFRLAHVPAPGGSLRLDAITPLGGHVTGTGVTEAGITTLRGEGTVPPLTPALLSLLPDAVVLYWWTELDAEGRPVRRTPYQALSVR